VTCRRHGRSRRVPPAEAALRSAVHGLARARSHWSPLVLGSCDGPKQRHQARPSRCLRRSRCPCNRGSQTPPFACGMHPGPILKNRNFGLSATRFQELGRPQPSAPGAVAGPVWIHLGDRVDGRSSSPRMTSEHLGAGVVLSPDIARKRAIRRPDMPLHTATTISSFDQGEALLCSVLHLILPSYCGGAELWPVRFLIPGPALTIRQTRMPTRRIRPRWRLKCHPKPPSPLPFFGVGRLSNFPSPDASRARRAAAGEGHM
jgi:hypothetical protein